MIHVSLCEFARTGEFGPIRLDMSRAEVLGWLGCPGDWGREEQRDEAAIWRYADIEFHFYDHKLFMIFTDHDDLTNGGETCRIDPWLIRPGLPRPELETALRAAQIGFTVSTPAWDTRQRHVITTADVKFSFLEERDPEWPEEELGLSAWNTVL